MLHAAECGKSLGGRRGLSGFRLPASDLARAQSPEPRARSHPRSLRSVRLLLNLVAMDCVEVAPAYDHAELTSQAAAAFIWTYLCGQIAKRQPVRPD